MEQIKKIVKKFSIKGDIIDIKRFGNGHINKTYLVETTHRKYTLQCINTYAFPNVELLMNNFIRVTHHLLEKEIFTIKLVPTFSGKLYAEDELYRYRVYKYIDNVDCYEGLSDLNIVEKVASAFGDFHHSLHDLDASLIEEVIPHFHNTSKRYKDFCIACDKDITNRLETCKKEADAIRSFSKYFGMIVNEIERGTIPVNITHNDPKTNNILFDKDTGEVKCVIDLDTVMPGSVLFDIGDALRSLFTGENEDNIDFTQCKVNLDVYKAYLKGYASKMKQDLNSKEIELIPYAPMIITIECAMRFLEDYLKGDVYFNTTYDKHNLIRARTQIYLAQDILRNINQLRIITNEIFNS